MSDIPISQLDALTAALKVIDYAHHEIHSGGAFTVTAVDESMGDNETLNIAWKTPDGTKRAHMIVHFDAKVGGDVQLWEGPVWTQGSGTAGAIINRKRLASPATSMLLENRGQETFTASNEVMVNVTGANTDAATSLFQHFSFGAQNNPAGAVRRDAEWVLKPDATYLVVFTADGATNAGQIQLDWYEHTDKSEGL